MEENKEMKLICRFCYKQFPSGKSLGGHIRIHTNENRRYNGKKKNRLVNHREIVAPKEKQEHCCRECVKKFVSLEALCAHMACHNQSDTESETSSAPTTKRSKRVLSNGSLSFASEIDKEIRDAAFILMMMMKSDSSYKKGGNFVVNSLGELSDNNSVIVETKSSPREELEIMRSVDDNGVSLCDSDSSDYFMNGPKKSDSDISVDGSFKNTGFGSGGSKVLPFYETDSWADTNNKNDRFRDSKSTMVKKKNKDHECPICFKVFKSGQALGGHKRSHNTVNQVAERHCQIDLNVPASDIDE